MYIIPSTVLVIEAQPLMRDALCDAISREADMKATMQSGDVARALQLTAVVIPDIILLAFDDQPVHDNMGDLALLRKAMPTVPMLVLSSNESAEERQAALAAGAKTLITKSASRKEIIRALRKLRAKTLETHLEGHLKKEADRGTISRSSNKTSKIHRKNMPVYGQPAQTSHWKGELNRSFVLRHFVLSL